MNAWIFSLVSFHEMNFILYVDECSCNIAMRMDDPFQQLAPAGLLESVTPVSGLIHASGVLQDAALSSHTPALLRKVQTPKASPILFPIPQRVCCTN